MSAQTIADTLNAISDDKSLVLFNMVVLNAGKTEVLITNLSLTKKQYYSRMSNLVKAGLIIRINGKYFPTSLGKIVYEAQMLIGKGIESYWKLKAIDSIYLQPGSPDIPTEEYIRLVSALIENNEIKDILLKENDKFRSVNTKSEIVISTSI